MALFDPLSGSSLPDKVCILVARARNGVIGVNGKLPWHLPEDLKFFKETTLNKTVVMGRSTFESIGRSLPNRLNIVMTRNPRWTAPNVKIAHGWEQLDSLTKDQSRIYVIGGADLIRSIGMHANEAIVTEIDADFEGDTYLDQFSPDDWREVSRVTHPSLSEKPAYSFVTLVRRGHEIAL